MKKTILILSIYVLMFLPGCMGGYYPPEERYVKNSFQLDRPYDYTWQSLINWFAYHKSSFKSIDTSKGEMNVEFYLTRDDLFKYADCGKFENYEPVIQSYSECIVKLRVSVSRMDSSSTLMVLKCAFNTDVSNYNYNTGQSTGYPREIDCVSNGRLEKKIYDDIK